MPRGSYTAPAATERAELTDADKAALRAQSEFVGTVNATWEGDVRVNHISDPVPSQFGKGDRYLYLLGDDDRNAIRTWGGRTFAQEGSPLKVALSKGDRVRIRAIVQKQEEYKGEKQTTLVKPVILAVS